MNGKATERMRRVASFLRDFFFPPTCPACAARLPIENPYSPFCGACRGLWEQEKLSPCPTCGLAMLDCVCVPPMLSDHGIRDALFLTAYRSGGASVPDRTVYYVKENRDGRVFEFLGRELSYRVRYYMRAEGIGTEETVVTYLPRRRRGVSKNGFDQARVLAAHLAREIGCEMRPILSRKHGGREQKTLDAEARAENLRNAFRVRRGISLEGKYVILVDDVMTTGSGLRVCAELLQGLGAARVVPAVIARTEEQKHKDVRHGFFKEEPMMP